MSDIKLISPMLDGFCIGEPISDQNGVRCCPAMKENEDDRYIVKVVSVPASQAKLDALLLAGAYPDAEAAKGYFQELADGIVDELNVLNSLASQEGFLPIRQWQVVPMEEGSTGFDVYMLTDYKRTLKRQFYKEPLTHLNAVNLGLDICEALAVCRRAGYLFVDLKPSNIFVTPEKKYKIGDLGFIKQNSLMFASLPAQYRSAYTAPEVADAFSALSPTMDIYALGLVLYQAYNNGALPFSGDVAPAEVFPAPDYADYEMAEIILKACDPNPENRWQDPIEMGQALISYMQRNGVNDTPIVPPAVILEDLFVPTEPLMTEEEVQGIKDVIDIDEPAQEAEAPEADEKASEDVTEPLIPEDEEMTEELTSEVEDIEAITEEVIEQITEEIDEQAPEYAEDDLGNLSFLTDIDEEIIEEVQPEQIEYSDLSDEVTEILEQADDLAAHDVPDMEEVVEQEMENTEEDPEAGEETESEPTETGDEETEGETAPQNTVIFSTGEDAAAEQTPAEEEPAEPVINPDPDAKPKRRWVGVLVVLLALLVGLSVGGFFGYKYYYIKTIDSLTLDGDLDTLTVSVKSNADPELLTVYCIGNGNRTAGQLVDGKAHFTNLVPEQRYNVVVEISGFHDLKGKTSSTYYTPSQVSLENLQVKVGEADGSAVITFTTKKPYDGQWNVEYVTEGEDKQTAVSATGNITLNNLTLNKTYEITVTPTDEHSWVTNNTCTFKALPLTLAQNVTVADYSEGKLDLVWQAPEGITVDSWTVLCYNDTDYNKTVTVSDCNVSFDALDPTKSYTVEIYAENQSKGQMIHIDDATLPIDNFTAELTEFNFIQLNWTCSKSIPEEGWIIKYTVDGVESEKTLTVKENSLLFKEVIPGAAYSFTIEAGNGAPVIVTDVEITAGEAENYRSTYGNQVITKDNISLKMCTPPNIENWSYKNLYNSDYTTTFSIGEKVGIRTKILKYYDEYDDSEVFVFYIIRDEQGNVVLYCSEERTWDNLWEYYFGALTIPEMPDQVGKYTIEVYFNGGIVGSQEFEIKE